MTERDWTVALTGSQNITYPPEALILKAGDTNRHLYLVRSGTLDVYKKIDGENKKIGTLSEGSIFGEISMLLRSKKGTITVDIYAATTAEICQIEINLVIGICETEPQIGASFGMMLARKLTYTLKGINNRSVLPAPDLLKNTSVEPPHLTTKLIQPEEYLTPNAVVILDSIRETESLDLSNQSSHKLVEKRSFYMKGILSGKDEKKKLEKTNTSGITSSAAVENRSPEDEKFQKIFSLYHEVVLRKFSSYHKKKNSTGTLYLTQNYICFYAFTFGFKIKERVNISHINDLQKIEGKESGIQITYNNKNTCLFTSFRNVDQAYSIIRDIWQARNAATQLSESEINDKIITQEMKKKIKK